MTEIKSIPIDQLILLDRNPRKITDTQFRKLTKSMEEDPDFLQARPILVNHTLDGNYIVYAGNQRVRAAQKLGWKQIPCIIEEDLSDETMKARIAKDNKSFGEWDFDILSSDYDISELLACGFTEFELGLDAISPGEGDLPEKKKKKKKICPECGHEF